MTSYTHKHLHFLRIANNNAISALKIADKINFERIKFRCKIKWIQNYVVLRELNKRIDCAEKIDIVISMCAFSLEALINFLAVHYQLDTKPGYNEKNPTITKWTNYPNEIFDERLNSDTLKLIEKILNNRNTLAHYKSKKNTDFSSFTLCDALETFNNTIRVFDEYSKIDINFNVDFKTFSIPKYAKGIGIDFVAVCQL